MTDLKNLKIQHQFNLLILAFIFITSLFAANYIFFGIPKLYDFAKKSWGLTLYNQPINQDNLSILENIKFIKSYTHGDHETVILSQHQGIYYLESGLTSAVNSPALIQLLDSNDDADLFKQLLTKPIKNYLSKKTIKIKIIFQIDRYIRLLTQYHIVSESKSGMFYLTK